MGDADDARSPRMLFGKYRGMPMDQIPESYLRWLLRQGWLEPWTRTAIEMELKDRARAAAEAEALNTLMIEDLWNRAWDGKTH